MRSTKTPISGSGFGFEDHTSSSAERPNPDETEQYASPHHDSVIPGPRITVDAARELAEYVDAHLNRYGVPGGCIVSSSDVQWRAGDFIYKSDFDSGVESWDSLSEAARNRIAQRIARALVEQRPSQAGSEKKAGFKVPVSVDTRTAVVLVGLAIGAFGFWSVLPSGSPGSTSGIKSLFSFGGSDEPKAPTKHEVKESRAERARRVCAAARNRVMNGATITIVDDEGWEVDLLLLNTNSGDSLVQHPDLRKYVEDPGSELGSKWIWRGEENLARIDAPTSKVVVENATLTGTQSGQIPGVRLRFRGGLTDAYFRPEERRAFYHIAADMMDELGATHGALFAQCEGDTTHHVGSWFRGADEGSAVASMVYSLGMFARPRHLAAPNYEDPELGTVDSLRAFDIISAHAKPLRRRHLVDIIGPSGGSVHGKTGEAVTITFPFKDGNRAERSSKNLARVLKLGI